MNKISEIPEQESIPENPAVETSADPWRCEECGSLEVSYRTWVDSNTGQVAPAAPEQDDLWCDGCEEHTYQIRESELMSDTVEPWWNDGTTEEDCRSVIPPRLDRIGHQFALAYLTGVFCTVVAP